ncbi:YkvA family protein [Roseibium sp. Sym1]|uniref:YkvA family protein n=1 Tax=Roseibium sp. Sym1 TaxID=3016006 RepID=UPI0022B36CA9|nr:YkvA family protein [Roseibium sp. Sym1]
MNTTFEDLGFDPEILGPEEEQTITVRQKLLATAKKAARQVPFMEDVVAGYYCALDPATPTKVRATLMAALAYFVLPVDTIPDFILGVGFGDDATVLMAAFAMIRSHMRADHYDAAREALKDDTL